MEKQCKTMCSSKNRPTPPQTQLDGVGRKGGVGEEGGQCVLIQTIEFTHHLGGHSLMGVGEGIQCILAQAIEFTHHLGCDQHQVYTVLQLLQFKQEQVWFYIPCPSDITHVWRCPQFIVYIPSFLSKARQWFTRVLLVKNCLNMVFTQQIHGSFYHASQSHLLGFTSQGLG